MKLKSIEQEAHDCREALNGLKVGDLVNFCHHEIPLERLTEPPENRIEYILECKKDNVALRLRLFRPAKIPVGDKAFDWLRAKYDQAHAKQIKAINEYYKVGDELDKAKDELFKTSIRSDNDNDKLDKLRVKCDKLRVKYDEAYVKYEKFYTEYVQAFSDFNEIYPSHFESLFGVKWRGSIFKTFLGHLYSRGCEDQNWI